MSKSNKTNENIPNAEPLLPQNAYVTWGDTEESRQAAMGQINGGVEEFNAVNHATANRYRGNFANLDGNTSSRPGLTRSDYDYFRPDEAVSGHIRGIFAQADDIYNRVGLVKNVIDLMGDFASQGIRLVHPNKRIERFYRNWFKKIGGEERSERFLNNLYRIGNVVVNRQTAKINTKVEKEMYKATAKSDIIIRDLDMTPTEKREIPWRYTFIDPACVEIVAGPLSSFVGQKNYSLVIPASLRKTILSPKTDAEKEIVARLPNAILEAAKSNEGYLLDPYKTLVFHYKKDDWRSWAYPMIYSIMDDINVIEKLKLADLAALDGAISNIRIFKLGSLEHKIAPTQAAANKLSSILQNNVGGGTIDLVWGPDLELIESKTNVHQFLGEAKYTPHLNSVYAGLGIPPTLTGTYGAAGTTNNFISLKTLTQRLQYGRKMLTVFWEQEIALVQKAMGFSKPALVEFDRMDLSNEDAEKALLIQLSDRNIVSDELVQRAFGFNPEMEQARIKRETKERDSGRRAVKAGPFFEANVEDQLKKIALQLGLATPSQVGLELDPKKRGELNALEMKAKTTPPKSESPNMNSDNSGGPAKPQAPNGRPRNSKDSTQRKTKKFAPRTGASLLLWTMEAQDKINEIMNPVLLDFYAKKNMRSLSSAEAKETENTKAKILFAIEPFTLVTEEVVFAKLNTVNSIDVLKNYGTYTEFAKLLAADLNRPLTTEEIKSTKSYVYNLVYNQ